MKILEINNRDWFGSKLLISASIFIFSLTFGINGQNSDYPSAPAAMRPTAEELQNAPTGVEEMRRKELQAQSMRRKKTATEAVNPILPPANDMFADAEEITGANGEIFGTNHNATSESGEPVVFGSSSVWYRWTAPANLSVTFEINGGTLDKSVLSIYMGKDVRSLNALASNTARNDDAGDFRSRVTFIANAGNTYYLRLAGEDTLQGTFYLDWEINRAETGKQFNFDGNTGSRVSDFGVFRRSTGYWYLFLSNTDPQLRSVQWGIFGDKLMPQDYDGDGATDIAVWRPGDGTFYVLKSMNSTFLAVQWGANGDLPVQGDFDGDDHADFAVWRAGYFYVQRFHGTPLIQQWGQDGDYLACGDFDGDGITDFGVQRGGPNAGPATFYILRSSDGNWIVRRFGAGNDVFVPGDFDGDGKTDIAIYRYLGPGTTNFYILRSSDGGFYGVPFAIQGDVAVTGDYFGDNRSDLCVWRWFEDMATGRENHFYCLTDGGFGNFYAFPFGRTSDFPVGGSNNRNY